MTRTYILVPTTSPNLTSNPPTYTLIPTSHPSTRPPAPPSPPSPYTTLFLLTIHTLFALTSVIISLLLLLSAPSSSLHPSNYITFAIDILASACILLAVLHNVLHPSPDGYTWNRRLELRYEGVKAGCATWIFGSGIFLGVDSGEGQEWRGEVKGWWTVCVALVLW